MNEGRTPLTPQDWHALIESRDGARLKAELARLDAPTAAEVLGEADPDERPALFRLLPKSTSSEVFAYLEGDEQAELIEELTREESTRLLSELAPDDASELLDELPEAAQRRLLDLMTPDTRARVQTLLAYPEASAGRFMTPDFVAVKADWTVEQALDHLRKRRPSRDSALVIYVVDADWRLLDALDLRRFVLADPSTRVSELMDHQYVAVSAVADQEQSVRTMMDYDLAALPVVNENGVLVGTITFDDVLDVQEEEFTEDAQLQGAVAPLEDEVQDAPLQTLYRARIGWLIILVFLNIPSGHLLDIFEDVLTGTGLLLFLPLLIASSGNAGTQAATLMVRALATGGVTASDWGRLLGREVLVAGALGVTMAVAVSLVGLWRGGIEIAGVVAITMLTVVLIGSLVGMSLPMLLTRFRMDPATASAPLVTALADISGVVIYVSFARYMLNL